MMNEKYKEAVKNVDKLPNKPHEDMTNKDYKSIIAEIEKVMDLELYLKRGLFYLSLTFFTLAAFAAIAILVERLIRPFYDPGAYFFAAIAAILTAFLYPKLRKLTKFMIEQLFYREKYNFRKAVLSFIQELSQQPDVSSLTANFTNKLIGTLNYINR